MTNYVSEMQQLRDKIAELEKKLTFQKGEKIDSDQDGNRGASQETTGEVDYSTFDNLAKKKILKQKMLIGE